MGVQINGSEGNVIATKGTYSGNVTIGGTLTYEDVTNIDSVGLITARNGISVTGGDVKVAAGIISASTNTDGTTNLLTLHADADGTNNGVASIKFTGNAGNHSSFIKGGHTTNGDTILTFHTDDYASGFNPEERLRITGIGSVGINAVNPNALLEVRGTAGTYTNAITVFSGNTTHSGSNAKNGIALHSFGDALGGGLSSNLLYWNSSSPSQSYATRSSGEIKFNNTTSSSQTSSITFGGYYKGTTTFIERLSIDSSGDVTIGTDSWSYKKPLNVQGSTGMILSLANYDTTTYAADTHTGIEMRVNTGNTGNQNGSCEIRAFKENGTNGNNARGLSFYTAGNGGTPAERLRITSAGHVTKAQQPYFVARAGSSRNDVTNQVLVFDTAVSNNGSHYDTSSSKFTAPVAGAYIFGGNPAYMETNDTLSIFIRKNGSNVYEIARVVAGSMIQHSMFGFSTLLYLAASDEVDLYITGQCHQNGTYSHWFGYLLG